MFLRVDTKELIKTTVAVAEPIWQQHFTPLIGCEQVAYMLDKYQSFEAITKQIEEGYHYYLVQDASTYLGYFAYKIEEEYLYISKLYINLRSRGKGIGKEMLKFLEERAKEKSLTTLRLNVYKGNEDTIAFYENVGFQTIEALKIEIGKGFFLDDYIMDKAL